VLYSRNSWNPGSWEPRTYEYDFATSTWTREADPPAVDLTAGIGRCEMAYDEALGRVVIFSHYGGISYDAAGHGWELVNLDPGLTSSYFSALVYDSVNKRLVVFDGGGGLGFPRGVIAVDPVTQSWQTLLKPSPQ
jgi:hypothetical protein